MSCQNDETIGACIGIGIILFAIGMVVLFFWIVLTDEYTIESHYRCVEYSQSTGKCSVQKRELLCRIKNGEILLRCDTVKECRDYCDGRIDEDKK